ncbi:MAG: MurR/RpiR family transcriptional regulator [Anaerolineales bacterium]|nr:MurR/RpiR family transcriptional regulator [Anaerolineales bacterium]
MVALEGVPSSLLLKIRALLPAMNTQEQKVGQYILSNADSVVHLAIGELAQRCHASDTTIFRFCRKVGAQGYQDFKIRLAQDMAANRTPIYVAVDAADTLVDVLYKTMMANVKALEDTLSVMNLAALEHTANALLAARRVDIYGSGGGAIAALDLQYKLMRLGVRAVPHRCRDASHLGDALDPCRCRRRDLPFWRVTRRAARTASRQRRRRTDDCHHQSSGVGDCEDGGDQCLYCGPGVTRP